MKLRKITGILLPAILLFAATAMASCVTVQTPVQEPYYVTEYTTENTTETYGETVMGVRNVIHRNTLQPYLIWSNPQLAFNKHKYIWYYGYDISGYPGPDNRTLKLTFYKQSFYEYLSVTVFDMDPRGQILAPPLVAYAENVTASKSATGWITSKPEISTYHTWFGIANTKLDFALFLGGKNDIFANCATADPLEFNTHHSRDIAVLITGPTEPMNCRFSAELTWNESIAENTTATGERTVPTQVEHRVLKSRTTLQSRQVPFWESFTAAKP